LGWSDSLNLDRAWNSLPLGSFVARLVVPAKLWNDSVFLLDLIWNLSFIALRWVAKKCLKYTLSRNLHLQQKPLTITKWGWRSRWWRSAVYPCSKVVCFRSIIARNGFTCKQNLHEHNSKTVHVTLLCQLLAGEVPAVPKSTTKCSNWPWIGVVIL
jgi:hypothetical protein